MVNVMQKLQKKINEEQRKHTAMYEQGRSLYKLEYIEEDNDIQEKVDDIVDKWSELCSNIRSWHEDLIEEKEKTDEQEKVLNQFIDILKSSDLENPFKKLCKLKPEGIKSEVEKLQVTMPLHHMFFI